MLYIAEAHTFPEESVQKLQNLQKCSDLGLAVGLPVHTLIN